MLEGIAQRIASDPHVIERASALLGGLRNPKAQVNHCTVTRDGRAFAELRPLPRRPVPAAVLLNRWRGLPYVDPAKLRAEIDNVLDASL